jgi:PAS domain S-box-containing protein
MPIVITDPRQSDNPIVLANTAFLELTGYTAEEVLGRNCRMLQGEGTSPAAIDTIREGISAERDTQVEILNYRKDGSAFWNQLNVSPVHDGAGKLLYFFASQIDVTDFRKVQSLEASEHRLLKEVDHRARNVLAVVNGIVRLSRSEDAARYAKSIQARVQALADAHTLLAERGEAPLEGIVRQQLDRVRSDQVTLSGPDVPVSAFVVQPLALALHELLDNAIAHGALSRPGGSVEVTWDGQPARGGFSIRWRETGGPMPMSEGPPGFGAAMLKGMIERQLRGTIQQDWGADGLTVEIYIPSSVETTADSRATA